MVDFTVSPVRRMAPVILAGWTILSTVYFSNYFYWKGSRNILGILPPPGDDFCQDVPADQCFRSDLFAFQVSSFLAILVCGCYGFYSWHISRAPHEQIPKTPEGRIFSYLPDSEFLCAVNFSFQSWDFAISLLIPEHSTPIMLSHHTMASIVSFSGLANVYLHHYAVFFLGLSEVSSIFLVFVDLSRFFPPVEGTVYDTLIKSFFAPLFVATFIFYRVILWWPVSFQLFRDSMVVWNKAKDLRPGKTWVLAVFLICNFPLGLLQLYWATLIFEEVYKVISGDPQLGRNVEAY